jgi:hypothetical protein
MSLPGFQPMTLALCSVRLLARVPIDALLLFAVLGCGDGSSQTARWPPARWSIIARWTQPN